jgi:hypothetical protein
MDTKKMDRHFNKNWILILILIIAAWLLGSFTEVVAETKKFRFVGQHTKMELMPVGDVEGHFLLISEFRGLDFTDSDVTACIGWAQCDVVKGAGLCQNYFKEVYGDGSTTVFKSQFKITIASDGKTGLYEDGKGEFIMGTGRFAGIKGSIYYNGKRITPISPGLKESKGDFFTEGTMTYTLPPK